ncbi:acyl-CoA dehydrogenase family protein [Pseudonocardia sp. TRM90224]|uniref:acyl-CoA dehydrogenase family protein n=1 Tax=Pseudonocardia sp. TRM90224 TaxID=2812678 RepID=UPI001E3C467B|nr:acyl-CoA dehydrogenase family protein [Pseudonocardia sp. TRM90224]
MAEYLFTEEQQDLRRGIRQFCAEHASEQAVRTLMESDTGYDPAVWARLGGELGVLGLAVPESMGGAGGGLVDQAVVAEEFGAALLPGPVFGTVGLAIPALVALGGDEQGGDELLSDLVEGRRTAGFAVPDRGGRFDPALVTVTASGGALTGELAQVVDGSADVLLVAACDGAEIGLYATDAGTRTPLSTLDSTRRQSHVRFDGTPARLLASGAAAADAITSAFHTGAALLAAEQVGGAQRLLDTTVAYAGTRLQFGRPIGSFQAVKHTCADMLVLVEHARSVAYHAAWALQDGSDDPGLAVSVAQAVCSHAYQRVATDTVQMLGGIGFTWEHPAHLYLKRAMTDAALLGSAAAHREHVAALVLDTATSNGVLAVAAG